MKYLKVDDSNRDVILELFDKSLDAEGYIIEKDGSKRVVCPYSNEYIHKSSFSILPGSATFVANKSYCFAEHIVYHSK